jgi:hypothetical protein
MQEALELVVGRFNLTNTFNEAINYLRCFLLSSTPTEQHHLRLAILNLRLCRWRNAVVQLVLAQEPEAQTLNGFLINLYLGSVEQLLKQGVSAADASEPSVTGTTASDGGWLVPVLQTLSRKHRGPVYQLTTGPTWTIDVRRIEDMITNISAIMDNLETTELDQRLEHLRSEDVYEIERHPRANEQDIYHLKASAVGVDTKLAGLLRFGGHQYERTTAGDKAQLHQGDKFAKDYKGQARGAHHSYRNTTVRGEAKVTQGNQYGY